MCYFQSRGAISCLQLIAQRRGLHSWLIWLWDAGVTYLHNLSISWWVVANPRTTLPSFQQTFSTIFDVTLLPARFSQSVILAAIWLYWKGRVCFQSILFSTDYGDDSFHCFSGPFIDPVLWGETGVFLHARCIHNKICNDCSEQVCDSCWIRHGGMTSSGNTFPGRNLEPSTWSLNLHFST